MKLIRLSIALAATLGAAYACGGTDGNGLFDGGDDSGGGPDAVIDNTVPGDASVDVIIADDSTTGDASDGGIIEAGPLCTSTPCMVEIASGGFHSCARVTDGTIRCWGRNNLGQLGVGLLSDGGFDGTMQPTPVNPKLANITQITASHFSVTYSSTCVLSAGVPKCFGANATGQLGLSADSGLFDTNAHPTAAAVQGIPSTVAGVWAGNLHACAIDTVGKMYCWGYDETLQLDVPAPGTNGNVLPAVAINTDAGAAAMMGPGYDSTTALLKGGGVLSWGANTVGQLGRTATSPSLSGVVSLTGVSDIAAGLQHGCAVSTGVLYCWGENADAELGQGSVTPTTSATPLTVNVGGKVVKQVTAGYSHTCALASDGTVYCWGQNDYGQCATGATDAGFSFADILSPTQVQGLTGKALQVEAGTNHTCALIEGGSVMCWGADDRGQLGQGLVDGSIDTNPHPTPVTVHFP